MRFLQTYCVVDHDLRLLWVGGDWDEFALANNGPHCVANEVLSKPLPSFICDDDTTEAVRRLIGVVRERQQELKIDYRCDSPVTTRRFQMTIQPMKDDRVLIVHDLRDARTLDRPLHPWRSDPKAKACKCSFCCAVDTGTGHWLAPERLVVEHPEHVRYTLCPTCVAAVEAAIESLETGRQPRSPVTGGFGP